jgi:hypothetical protein
LGAGFPPILSRNMYFVATTVTRTPDQSAMAFPKNDPTWVPGSDTLYRKIHRMRIATDATPRECRRMKLTKLLDLSGIYWSLQNLS